MHVGDTIFIFCLALIIFGPKKLPEIGRQIGKLMVEFRRASNEFKMQIEEELRASDEAERQKEITAAAAATSSTTTHSIFPDTSSSETGIPVIAPPATGLPVNHTFASAENGASTAQESEMRSTSPGEEAYPEPETEFNPGLNTASNSEAVEGSVEIAGLQNGLTRTSEEMEVGKVQAPLQHG